MGFLDNLFDDTKKKGDKLRQQMGQIGKPKMSGAGYSPGGSKPGEVYQIIISEPGPVGIRVEQKSNNSASAIVNQVVPGSQAEAAGLQRGDVLCFAGSEGQSEIPYSMFLEMAKSPQRPLRKSQENNINYKRMQIMGVSI